ncbi:hypothetical protein, partial [Dermacoccus nishinomiyaensis]|uniref:hypothetical protein n=1 Tax=Dermacoccus nishinomiyaensis TaxID=1274 RepID=UPI001C92F4F2
GGGVVGEVGGVGGGEDDEQGVGGVDVVWGEKRGRVREGGMRVEGVEGVGEGVEEGVGVGGDGGVG